MVECARNRALAVAWFAGFRGFAPTDLVREAGIARDRIEATVASLVSSTKLAELALASAQAVAGSRRSRVSELETQIQNVLAVLHSENPLATTHDRQKVLARLDYVGDESVTSAVTDQL